MTREERHIAVLNRMLENMNVFDSIKPTEERKRAIKEAIKALDQKSILDDIRVEIALKHLGKSSNICVNAYNDAINDILKIIDKYRGE